MFVRSLFANSIIVLLMSIAPARAQYSFMRVLGGDWEDWPKGMIQLSNGTFVVFGSADSPLSSGANYISNLGLWGDINWERFYTNSYGYSFDDCFQSKDGFIYACGNFEWNLNRNAGFSKVDINGRILLDTFYRHQAGASSGIMKVIHNDQRQIITSVGGGGPELESRTLAFQRTTYQGKRLWIKYMPIIYDFRFKDFYKHIDKEEYFLFAEKHLMRVDSTGKQIGNVEQLVDIPVHDAIRDMTQLEDGKFILLVNNNGSQYLEFLDQDGKRTARKITLPSGTGFGFGAVNSTRNKGIVVAGRHLLLLDSNDQTIWMKPLINGDTMGIECVAQAADGGFYGCGISDGSFATRNLDIYAFKTTPEGEIRTGLKENAGRLNMQVMPNPSEGVFRISGEFNNEKVSVSNLLGRVVQEPQPLAANGILDVSHLKAGVYILTVTTKDETYVRKITIRK